MISNEIRLSSANRGVKRLYGKRSGNSIKRNVL